MYTPASASVSAFRTYVVVNDDNDVDDDDVVMAYADSGRGMCGNKYTYFCKRNRL